MFSSFECCTVSYICCGCPAVANVLHSARPWSPAAPGRIGNAENAHRMLHLWCKISTQHFQKDVGQPCTLGTMVTSCSARTKSTSTLACSFRRRRFSHASLGLGLGQAFKLAINNGKERPNPRSDKTWFKKNPWISCAKRTPEFVLCPMKIGSLYSIIYILHPYFEHPLAL